jgi:hypothetical protein
MPGCAVTEVQAVVHAVFVMITTVDCEVCWFPSADDKAEVPGRLVAGTKVIFGTLDLTGTMVLNVSSLKKEVGKAPRVSRELIEVEESKQLVSVTVVLSVTVTIDMGKGFFWVEVEVFMNELMLIPEPVEAGNATETPVA